MNDNFELLFALESGTYRVSMPRTAGRPEDIQLRNSEGQIYVPTEPERRELLTTYEFLSFLAHQGNISDGLTGITDQFWSSADTIDGGYIERFLDYTDSELRMLQARLDDTLLERVVEQGRAFSAMAVDVAWGVATNVVLKSVSNPLAAFANAIGEVATLTSAIREGFELSNEEEISSISALMAVRDALDTLRSLQADMETRIQALLGPGSETVLDVDQVLQLESDVARIGLLQRSIFGLVHFHAAQFPPDEVNPSPLHAQIWTFLNSPIELEFLISLIPVVGPAVDIWDNIQGYMTQALIQEDMSNEIAYLSQPVSELFGLDPNLPRFDNSDAFARLDRTLQDTPARGTDGNDTIYGGEGETTIDARAGDDFIRLDDGHGLVIGGTGEDTVAVLTDQAFDLDKLVERVDGSFVYRLSDSQTVTLESVEYLRFVSGQTVTAEYPLQATARLFGLSPGEGISRIFSATVADPLSQTAGNALTGASSLTVDGAGHFAVTGYDVVSFRNLGGHYATNPGLRVTTIDPADGQTVRSDLYIGSYSHNISPSGFDYVPGVGMIALGTVNYGGSLFYGLSLTAGVEDLAGFGTFLSDEPIGTANWHYGAGNPSDPLFAEGSLDLYGNIVDSAASAGRLVALSSYATPDGVAQRLLSISTPLNTINDYRADNAYQHLSFLDGSAHLTAIAFGSDGQLFGIAESGEGPNPPQQLFAIDQQTGTLTQIGALPGTYTDFVVTGTAAELTQLLAPAEHVSISGTDGNDDLAGQSGNDTLLGGAGHDRLRGEAGNDSLNGGDGTDTLIGADGDDTLIGGDSRQDLRDVIYGGAGHDSLEGGYGNDELRGDAGNDTILGGFGADTVLGGDGDDILTAQAFGDDLFGGNGDDFINGGFGHDRVNGGAGGDRFFHIGVFDHGSDWIQDYASADGDVLQFGAAGTRDQFQVNFTETANAGAAGVEEAFVIYRPTGQILWALVDGGAQSQITLRIGTETFDLLA